jgi:hypothetical protein
MNKKVEGVGGIEPPPGKRVATILPNKRPPRFTAKRISVHYSMNYLSPFSRIPARLGLHLY